MISYVELNKSINKTLKDNFPDIHLVANDIRSGFKKPAFFVQLNIIEDNTFEYYCEKKLMIDIHYFSDIKTNLDNLKILDKLNKIFLSKVEVKNRKLNIEDRRYSITDNVLQFKFDINFTDEIEGEFINGEFVPATHDDELEGYTTGNTELMQKLNLKGW